MKPLPADLYETIDPAVVYLCRVINENFPGMQTVESCQGFIDGHRPGHDWGVWLKLDHRRAQVRNALEDLAYVVWMINGDSASKWRGHVRVEVIAFPPYLNRNPLSFYIRGSAGAAAHPDEVARQIEWYIAKLQEPAE